MSDIFLSERKWSSVDVIPFMSIIVHCISDCLLKSHCPQAAFIPDNHTAVLLRAWKNVLVEWLLKEAKLLCIRIDNGANIVAVVRSLGWLWLNCFGHNLCPAVTSSVASESQHLAWALGLCKSLVSTFYQSWIKKRKPYRVQEEIHTLKHRFILLVFLM